MLTKEEYIKKELDRYVLKPIKQTIDLENIDFSMSLTQLNELIAKYKKEYTDDEIEISPEYNYDIESPNIAIRAIIPESEEEFNNRVGTIRRRIEMDYDRMAKALEI
jgi:hypothetical protein